MGARKYNEADFQEYISRGEICFYCSENTPFESITLDHLLPRNRGFTFKNNKVFSCSWCNSVKGSFTIYQFRELLSHAFAFYANRKMFHLCDKILKVMKKCSELLKDRNGILYSEKERHGRGRPGSSKPYYPIEKDIIRPTPFNGYFTRIESTFLKRYPRG